MNAKEEMEAMRVRAEAQDVIIATMQSNIVEMLKEIQANKDKAAADNLALTTQGLPGTGVRLTLRAPGPMGVGGPAGSPLLEAIPFLRLTKAYNESASKFNSTKLAHVTAFVYSKGRELALLDLLVVTRETDKVTLRNEQGFGGWFVQSYDVVQALFTLVEVKVHTLN